MRRSGLLPAKMRVKTKLNQSKTMIRCWLIASQQQKGPLAHFCAWRMSSYFIVSAQAALMKRNDVDIKGGWKVGEP